LAQVLQRQGVSLLTIQYPKDVVLFRGNPKWPKESFELNHDDAACVQHMQQQFVLLIPKSIRLQSLFHQHEAKLVQICVATIIAL
jgi:hypothetical protein